MQWTLQVWGRRPRCCGGRAAGAVAAAAVAVLLRVRGAGCAAEPQPQRPLTTEHLLSAYIATLPSLFPSRISLHVSLYADGGRRAEAGAADAARQAALSSPDPKACRARALAFSMPKHSVLDPPLRCPHPNLFA